MSDDNQTILQKLQERLFNIEQERQRLMTAIQVVMDASGIAGGPTIEPDPAGKTLTTAASGPLNGYQQARKPEIRPDSYFGMSHHQAARKYLLDLGHADKAENILAALTAGGVDVGGVSPVDTLRATFTKNSTVFVRVGPNTFGLREAYPHLQGRPKRVVFRRTAVSRPRVVLKRIARKRKIKKITTSSSQEDAPPENGT